MMMLTPQTQKLISQHIGPISTTLRQLQSLLAAFGQELAHESRPAVVFAPVYTTADGVGEIISDYRELDAGRSRRSAIEAILQIEYGMEDRVNQSTKCYGALGVPRRLINQATLINRAKSEFKDAMQAVAKKRVRVVIRDQGSQQVVTMKNLSNVILRRVQKSSVNLLAAYRDIPFLEETPHAIQLTHTRTRSVPRKTAAALLAMLADRDDGSAAVDRERLEALNPNEYLVSPKEHYPRMRANVFYRRRDSDGKPEKRMVMAELPILYPIRKGVRPPDLSKPSVRRTPRKHPASYIEAEEYVKTHHYRRMQAGHRQFAGKS